MDGSRQGSRVGGQQINRKTAVIHRKGAKSAKDAKKINDLPEVVEGFVIHLLGEWAMLHQFCFLCDLCTFAPLR